eukprot:GGOE01045454.1.p2 GENE.GGOE01045454.1~~GGOE01045454.1.p2  ORF type:complete len:161 (+),score=45.34 GGOE01045454.1:30-485(+)
MADAEATAPRRRKAPDPLVGIEASLKRIANQKGVLGYIVLDPKDGSIFKSVGLEDDLINKYAQLVLSFVSLTQSVVRDLDPVNHLTFLRLCSRKNEIIVAPDKEFVFVVVQDYHVNGEEEKAQIKVLTKEQAMQEAAQREAEVIEANSEQL